jgi:LuxR family transcriptional regulator, regulator of acetate metabolism
MDGAHPSTLVSDVLACGERVLETGDDADLDELLRMAAAVRARLRTPSIREDELRDLGNALVRSAAVHRIVRRRAIEGRLSMLENINARLARLRDIDDIDELLPAACREMAECLALDRVAISRLEGSTLRTVGVWHDDAIARDEPTIRRAWSVTVPIDPRSPEARLRRTSSAALVLRDDLPDDHPLVPHVRTGVLVSTVVVSGRVMGFVHADRAPEHASLTATDAQELGLFATGFGMLVERTMLVQRVSEHRRRVHEIFADAERQLRALTDDELSLARQPPGGLTMTIDDDGAASVHGAPLSPREHEVMELLASGARNAQIARQLGLSESTIKGYVTAVLRKLGATTRAEAVARYTMVPVGSPAGARS